MESGGIFAVTAKSMATGRRSDGSYIPEFVTHQERNMWKHPPRERLQKR